MKYYTSTTQFNCGVDLHAHQMYVCLMDRQGNKLLHTNIRNNDFDYFLKRVAPYRANLTVVCECMFGWYWLSDACANAGIQFVLAHALYLKAIHGGKNKNDRIDSEKLAHLLRTNLIPPAYVYPAPLRPLRVLLRQRIYYVWSRADLLARIQSQQLAHNRPALRQTRPNRDPQVIGPLAQRLEARMNGNKFKANTVLAIKLARAVYFMLRQHTVFDPDRLVGALARN